LTDSLAKNIVTSIRQLDCPDQFSLSIILQLQNNQLDAKLT
jgi:hypothetical protein